MFWGNILLGKYCVRKDLFKAIHCWKTFERGNIFVRKHSASAEKLVERKHFPVKEIFFGKFVWNTICLFLDRTDLDEVNDILDEWFASEGLDEDENDEKITEMTEPEPEPVVEEEIIEKVKINK